MSSSVTNEMPEFLDKNYFSISLAIMTSFLLVFYATLWETMAEYFNATPNEILAAAFFVNLILLATWKPLAFCIWPPLEKLVHSITKKAWRSLGLFLTPAAPQPDQFVPPGAFPADPEDLHEAKLQIESLRWQLGTEREQSQKLGTELNQKHTELASSIKQLNDLERKLVQSENGRRHGWISYSNLLLKRTKKRNLTLKSPFNPDDDDSDDNDTNPRPDNKSPFGTKQNTANEEVRRWPQLKPTIPGHDASQRRQAARLHTQTSNARAYEMLLESQLASIKGELDNERKAQKARSEQSQALAKEISDLKAERDELRRQVEENKKTANIAQSTLQTHVSAQNAAYDKLNTEVESRKRAESEIAAMATRLAEAEAATRNSIEDLEEARAQIASLEARNQQPQDETSVGAPEVAEIQTLRQRIFDLEMENAEVEGRLESLQTSSETAQQSTDEHTRQLEAENKSLRAQVQAMTVAQQESENQHTAGQDNKTTAEELLAQRTAELQQVILQRDQTAKSLEEWMAHCNSNMEKLVLCNNDLQTALRHNAELEDRFRIGEEQFQRLTQSGRAQDQERIAELETQLAAASRAVVANGQLTATNEGLKRQLAAAAAAAAAAASSSSSPSPSPSTAGLQARISELERARAVAEVGRSRAYDELAEVRKLVSKLGAKVSEQQTRLNKSDAELERGTNNRKVLETRLSQAQAGRVRMERANEATMSQLQEELKKAREVNSDLETQLAVWTQASEEDAMKQ